MGIFGDSFFDGVDKEPIQPPAFAGENQEKESGVNDSGLMEERKHHGTNMGGVSNSELPASEYDAVDPQKEMERIQSELEQIRLTPTALDNDTIERRRVLENKLEILKSNSEPKTY